MFFGFSNISACFQSYINKMLTEKFDIFVVVHLDDILIYTKNLDQPYIDAVKWILKQLWKHGFYANLKKCQFYKDEIHFLSFVVLAQGIKIEEEKIEAVKVWPKP